MEGDAEAPASGGQEVSPVAPKPPDSGWGPAGEEGEPCRKGAPRGDGVEGLAALSPGGGEAPEPPVPCGKGPSSTHDRSMSGSSTCSSLNESSQESDEVFSEEEEKGPSGRKKVLRKTKSWKTFFTMVHWSLRRHSSWVQLAGHEGNFRPSEGGQILKKFSAVEDACLAALMADALRPYVPTYHGVVETGGQRYIQMADLLRGLDMPSIMDCKMGLRTYLEEELSKALLRPTPRRDLYQKMVKVDPAAPTLEERNQGAITKPRYMQWRERISSTASLGFRIEGVTVEGGAVQKDFKQTRTKEQIVEMFLTFTKGRRDVLSTYLSRLESMQGALRESAFFKTHEVIGSSLLFVHDRQGRANVWMIDFGKTLPAPAHLALRHDVAWTRGNHEDGYLIGLRRLADSLGAALRQMEQPGEDGAATEPGAAPTPPQETQQGGSPDAGGVGGSSTAERGRCHQHGGEPARQQTPAGRRNASHPTSLAPDGSTPPSPQPGTSARGRVLNRGVCGGDPS